MCFCAKWSDDGLWNMWQKLQCMFHKQRRQTVREEYKILSSCCFISQNRENSLGVRQMVKDTSTFKANFLKQTRSWFVWGWTVRYRSSSLHSGVFAPEGDGRYKWGMAIFWRIVLDRSCSFWRICVHIKSIATALFEPGTIYLDKNINHLEAQCGYTRYQHG